MEASLLGKNLTEDNYELYIENIINIFRLSSKESSIIFDLKLRDNKCLIKLSVVNQNGEREEYNDATLKCDEVFYEKFLDVLVHKILMNAEIVTKDIVDFDDDPLVTFRMITANNDLFSIDGLTATYASKLLNSDGSEEVVKVSYNNAGIGNVLTLILMISILIITFILIVVIFK